MPKNGINLCRIEILINIFELGHISQEIFFVKDERNPKFCNFQSFITSGIKVIFEI